jgi:hypothetical protein
MKTANPQDYEPPVDQLLKLGVPQLEEPRPEYRPLGISESDVPALIRMATDPYLLWGSSSELHGCAPIHAWRALGELRAEAAIHKLIGLFRFSDERGDDWLDEELPKVLGRIGPQALFSLRSFLVDDWHGPMARTLAANAIREIAVRHPEARDNCVVMLAQQLEKHAENGLALNAFLICDLLDLRATEAAGAMEAAFAAGHVGVLLNGDWEDVQIELGLLEERLTPPPTREEFWERMGVGSTDAPKPQKKKRGRRKRKKSRK